MKSHDYVKSSIGGWLGLLAGLMALHGYNAIADAIAGYNGLYIPGLPGLFSFAILLELCLVVAIVDALYLLIKRDLRFRRMFVFSVAIEVFFSSVIIRLYAIDSALAMAINAAITHALWVMMYGAIWIPYVYKSKRLKNRLIEIEEVAVEIIEPLELEDYVDGRIL